MLGNLVLFPVSVLLSPYYRWEAEAEKNDDLPKTLQ